MLDGASHGGGRNDPKDWLISVESVPQTDGVGAAAEYWGGRGRGVLY